LAERAPQACIRLALTTISRHHPLRWTRWTLVRCVQNKCWKATVDRHGPRYHAQVTVPNTKSCWTWHYISAPRIILAPKSSTKTMTRSAGRRFNCSSRVLLGLLGSLVAAPTIIAAASSVEAAPLPEALPPSPEPLPEPASPSAVTEADLDGVKTDWSQYWRRRRRRLYRRYYRRPRRRFYRRHYRRHYRRRFY